MTDSRSITLVAAGDAIITHRLDHLLGSDERFLAVVDAVRAADVATVNLEVCAFARRKFGGWPAAQSGGGYLVGSPACVGDLAAMGFGLFARGNNHAMDFGIEGLDATDRTMDSLGLLHAGTGAHLADAARAVYHETPAGRVAMVSFATTFPVSAKAGEQRHDTRGRPGVNGVTIERSLRLAAEVRQVLESAAERYGRPTLWTEANLRFADVDADVDADAGAAAASLVAEPNRRDVERVVRAIEVAAEFADLVVVNGHSHEPSNPVVEVPEWYQALARGCIDAGAHAFIGHGPHQIRGIEVHRGRPIFYSLGNFVCQRDAHDPIPADQYQAIGMDPRTSEPDQYVRSRDSRPILLNMTEPRWYESVLPQLVLRDGELVEARLIPLDLDGAAPPGRRGIPRVAFPEHAASILAHQSELSAPFGVSVDESTGAVTW